MSNQIISYPQYRKYRNGKSYFRIVSASGFDEIRVMGAAYFLDQFNAKILPDRNLIYDMTFDFEASWIRIGEEEFLEALSKVKH